MPEPRGHLTVWIEPGLAEMWLPETGQGYTAEVNGERLRTVVTAVRPGDGGLWMDLDVRGRYPLARAGTLPRPPLT